jgi:hypothetical protein
MTFVDDAAPDADKQVGGEAGFTRFRHATETPFKLVLVTRP